MNWVSIARKDASDAIRSRSVWLVTAVFLALFGGVAYAVPAIAQPEFDVFLQVMGSAVATVVPLVALVLGYRSVVGERETGSIELVLSMPHSRLDLIVGKFVGRSAVLAVPLAVGMVLAAVVGAVRVGGVEPGRYLGLVVATVLLGLSFLGLAVGLSLVTTERRRVTAGAFGAYLALVVLWDTLLTAIVLVLFRFRAAAVVDPPAWATLLEVVEPTTAYAILASDLLGVESGTPLAEPGAPWFVDGWISLLVLLGWIAVPLAVGYWRFRATDL